MMNSKLFACDSSLFKGATRQDGAIPEETLNGHTPYCRRTTSFA